jgi:small-conductance mechanosensitive channel
MRRLASSPTIRSAKPGASRATEVGFSVVVVVAAVWCAALDQLHADIERAKRNAAAEIDQGNCALESSIKINEELEAERKTLLQRVASLTTDCVEARLALRQVEDLKRALKDAEQRADDRRKECDTLKEEVATLRGHIDSLKEQGGLLRGLLGPKPRSRVTAKRGRGRQGVRRSAEPPTERLLHARGQMQQWAVLMRRRHERHAEGQPIRPW